MVVKQLETVTEVLYQLAVKEWAETELSLYQQKHGRDRFDCVESFSPVPRQQKVALLVCEALCPPATFLRKHPSGNGGHCDRAGGWDSSCANACCRPVSAFQVDSDGTDCRHCDSTHSPRNSGDSIRTGNGKNGSSLE